jgi:hypothetical protein
MQTIHHLVNFIANQPPSTWTTVLSYLGGSTLVASLLQVVKHKLSIADAKKLVTILLGTFSFVAAFADYLLSTTAQNPTSLGRNTAAIMAGAVLVHRFAVSPVYNKVVLGLTGLLNDAAAYRASIAPVEPLAATPEPSVETPTFQV